MRDGERGDNLQAAETGSLVHEGIEAYHKSILAKNKVDHAKVGSLAILSAKENKYIDGDVSEAIKLFQKYIERDKAENRGRVRHVEEKVKITLQPAPFDPTQKEIVIWNTIDQIREIGDNLIYVCDHKAGMKLGPNMVLEYMSQLASYTLCAHSMYQNKQVKTFILRTRDLLRRDLPFWWPMPFTVAQCNDILLPVRLRIAHMRMGLYEHTAGKHCDWCPFQNAYPRCISLGLKSSPVTNPSEKPTKDVGTKLKPGLKSLDDLWS